MPNRSKNALFYGKNFYSGVKSYAYAVKLAGLVVEVKEVQGHTQDFLWAGGSKFEILEQI